MDHERIRYRVAVDCDACWGHLVGEDSGEESCRLCVDLCPEVFEKPRGDDCARSRPDVDPGPHVACIREAMRRCPTEAIHLSESPSVARALTPDLSDFRLTMRAK